MKRKHEGTGDEPNAKRTKTEGLFQALHTIGQDISAYLHDWLWGEQTQECPSEYIPEEGIPLIADEPVADVQPIAEDSPQLVTDVANTFEAPDEEIDADLQEALALSLMADTNEEDEKAEEKPADKPVVPFERKAQKITAVLYSLWQKKFVNKYERNSPLYMKHKISFCNKQIENYFQNIKDSKDEETFQNTIFDIMWTALNVAQIFKQGFTSGGPGSITADYAMFDKFLVEHNLVAPFKKKMLAEYDETLSNYKKAFQFLTRLKSHNEAAFEQKFWNDRCQAFKSIGRNIDTLEQTYSRKKLAELEKDLVANFETPVLYQRKYLELIEPFKGSLMSVEGFFDANFVCNKMKLPSEVTGRIMFEALNSQSEVLQFSQAQVTKIQEDMWAVKAVKAEKDNSSVKKLSPNKK